MSRNALIAVRGVATVAAVLMVLWPLAAWMMGVGIEQFEPRSAYTTQLVLALCGAAILLIAVLIGFKAHDRIAATKFGVALAAGLGTFVLWLVVLGTSR